MSTRATPARTRPKPPCSKHPASGIQLEGVKHPMAKRGFVLLPRRWVVEPSFAWNARFTRLSRDYQRLDTSLKGFHYLAFASLMVTRMYKALA
jgi:transposase